MQEDSPRPEGADYLDFDLEIGTGTGRDYPVAVLDSPAGGARGNMHFPFDELVLENRLLTLQNALLRSGGEPRRTLSPEEQKVRDFGRALFEALFIPEVRSCYDVSLREAARQGRGLRLKLRIQPPELAALPWEYLYHPGQCEYVSLSTQTPVVRYLEVPQRVQPLVVEPPLRILGMIASPSDLPSLDVEREKGRIEHAIQDLQARGMVDLVWLPGQSWRDLQRAMRQGPWHIFHFIGHGGFDRNAGEGLIALADREGRADRFHATRLGRLLADHPSLRLVLLNSCEGARGSERDVFSSTASILVRRGIPAVLAMQYEITDRAAVEFARTFYEALADGMPVDGAVAEARKAISFALANTVEWGTPVLYTRAPGGVLFQVTGAPRVERPTTEEPRPPPQVEKRLERLYVDGLGAFWIEEWDEACRCFQAIVDEQPDYRDAAARLEQAEHQRRLVALYTEAQSARAAKDWTGEFMALDRLVAEEPGFKDAVDLREAAKRKRQLARLYAQAQELHAVGRWQAVVNVFARIAALDPEYPDPEALLSTAERGVAEQERQGELNDLYRHALREMDAGQWGEARGLLAQIQEMEAGYRETERLLARAEAEIADQERQAELDGLYSDALQAVEAGRWQEARGLLAQIQDMEGGYRETEQLLAKVEAELAEQQRQAELDGLYSRTLREMNAGRWAEARQLLIEIQEQEPGYRATERLLTEAGARLEQETTARQVRQAQRTSEPAVVTRPTASRRRLPGCVIAAIGGLGLITFIVAVVLLSGGLGGKATPAATEAPAQEAMPEPTEAPAEVDFPVMPGGFLEKAIAGEYAGTEVTVDGPFEDPDALYFFESMEAFEEATGITVNYIGDREFEARLASRVEAGDPPDIADFRNPGTAAHYARQGHLVDPTLWISEQWLKQQYNQSWLDMAQMHGQTGGVWHRFNTFSLVWYPKDDFEAAGYEIPTSWDELLALTQQIADDGDTAWCIGIESGASTGWVATDWTEELLLRTTSLDNYDAWVAGILPFESPEVKTAVDTWSNIWFNDDYVYGGRDNIVSTYFVDAPAPMFEDPPKCWLHLQHSFITDLFPEDSELGVDYDFFYFPPVDERYGKPFLVAGDLMSMFNDRPEVRALMEYFTTPQSVRGWLTNGGALAAHQTATPDMYGADLERRMVELVQEATGFRFRGSDLMPREVGAGSFWLGMTDYVSGATDLDTVLVDIDESWPRPTAAPEEPAPAPTEAPAEELAPEPEVTAVPAPGGPEGTLTIALSNFPNSLDRPQAADRQAANASTQMWDSLVWVNEEGEIEPALAESYEISEDGTEYTFHLRNDVVFHNGEPFNADSVLLTWERAANADYVHSFYFTRAESVEKIDDYTVRITTPEPDALFLRLMADYWAMIPPQYYEEVGEEGFVEHPIGTGPFMFVEWVKGDHITMEANPNYWREGLPKVKTLIFRPIPESTVRVAAIQTGDVDVVGRLSSEEAQSLLGASDVKVIRYPTTRIYYIAFNNLTTGVGQPTEDPRVRQAMNYAVDVEAIIDGLFDGFAEPATGFVAFGEMGYGVVEPIAYDPDKARELLAEAGYPDGFEMDFACPNMYFLDQVCDAVQGYLSDVGIETSLDFIESDQFWDLEAQKQLPPLFGDGWSSSPGEAYNRLHGALGGWDAPYSSWSDPVIDEFLANIEQAIDFEERKKLYEDLQVYMQEDPPFIYLYQPLTFEAINTRVQNYTPRPTEGYYLKNTWVVTEE